jgi:hypothetical protein
MLVPAYTTYGFAEMGQDAIVVDPASTTDSKFVVMVSVRPFSPTEVVDIHCAVSLSTEGQPTGAEILAGVDETILASNGPADGGYGVTQNLTPGYPGETITLTSDLIEDNTEYDISCAYETAGVTVVTRLENQRTIGFVGPLKTSTENVPSTDTYIISPTTSQLSQVWCVAFDYPATEPLASAIIGATGPYVANSGVATTVNPYTTPDFTFTGLSEASVYEVYCAIENPAAPDGGILSEPYMITTSGFITHPQLVTLGSDTKCAVQFSVSKAKNVTCVAQDTALPAPTTGEEVWSMSRSTGNYGRSVSPGSSVTFTVEGLTAMREYSIVCATKDKITGNTATCMTTGSSGIEGDPHVLDSEGQYVDFYGEAGVYNLYETEAMSVTGRFDVAKTEGRMLYHPTVMKAGTVMKEAGIVIGDVQLRVSAHGLVSVTDPMAPTSFLTAAKAETFTVGDVTVEWTPEVGTKTAPWGDSTTSALLTLKTDTETLNLWVAESQGYQFLDAKVSTTASAGAGLLNQALESPAALTALLKSQREANFMLGGVDSDLFAPQLDCTSTPKLN